MKYNAASIEEIALFQCLFPFEAYEAANNNNNPINDDF